MKRKTIFLIILCLILLFTTTTSVFAAYEATTEFAQVDAHNGTVYTTYYAGSNGGFRYKGYGFEVHDLPWGMMNDGLIYSFCFYHDKIYYMTGEDGSDCSYPAKIYSCDLNGQNNRLLADNVEPWSEAFIIDNILYYQAYQTYGLDYRIPGRTGGIFKINLEDLSWYKLPNTNYAKLYYCDGDYAYCNRNDSYFAIGCFDFNWVNMPSYADEYQYTIKIRGNESYYALGSGYCACEIRNNSLFEDASESYLIENVTDHNVYLTTPGYDRYTYQQTCVFVTMPK